MANASESGVRDHDGRVDEEARGNLLSSVDGADRFGNLGGLVGDVGWDMESCVDTLQLLRNPG